MNIFELAKQAGAGVEVLRLTQNGIWANPDFPPDEAAKLVLAAFDFELSVLVQEAVKAEREECAKVCESYLSDSPYSWGGTTMAEAIRARKTT
jgi:hypothetical protein